MKINWFYLLSISALVLLFFVFAFFKQASPNHGSRLDKIQALSQKPISWTVKDIFGEKLHIQAQKGRKYIFINLWATWCAPCIEELPALSFLAETNKDTIMVVAVSSESKKEQIDFVKNSFKGLSPYLKFIFLNSEEKNRIFPEDMLPVTYIFNEKGLLFKKEIGVKDWRALAQFLNKKGSLTNK